MYARHYTVVMRGHCEYTFPIPSTVGHHTCNRVLVHNIPQLRYSFDIVEQKNNSYDQGVRSLYQIRSDRPSIQIQLLFQDIDTFIKYGHTE